MQFWKPFQKNFTKRRRLFPSNSEMRIELCWFQKTHFSSNIPLDTEIALLRTLPFFLHNAEKCYHKIRGRFLYCFLSNRLSFLKISSGLLICILRVLLISFSEEAEIQWQKKFTNCDIALHTVSLDRWKAVLTNLKHKMFSSRGSKFFEKKNNFPQTSKVHLFSKGFFNGALGGFDNTAWKISLNSWESCAQIAKKFKI